MSFVGRTGFARMAPLWLDAPPAMKARTAARQEEEAEDGEGSPQHDSSSPLFCDLKTSRPAARDEHGLDEMHQTLMSDMSVH